MSNAFGSGTNPFGTSPFGTQQNPAQSNTAFGSVVAPVSPFNQPTVVFGQDTSPFSQTASAGQTNTTSLFGQQSGFGQTSAPPAFGQNVGFSPTASTTTQANPTTASLFAGQTANSAFGNTASAFGQSGSALFGQPKTSISSSTFGTSTSVFTQQSSQVMFGQTINSTLEQGTGPASNAAVSISTSAFKATDSKNPFGTSSSLFQRASPTASSLQSASQVPSLFGKSQTSASPFGTSQTSVTQQSTPFATASASTSSGLFGQTSSFEQPKTESKSAFKQPASSTEGLFEKHATTGTGLGQGSGFRQPGTSLFGKKEKDEIKTQPGLFGKGVLPSYASATSTKSTSEVGDSNELFGKGASSKSIKSEPGTVKIEGSGAGVFGRLGTTGAGMYVRGEAEDKPSQGMFGAARVKKEEDDGQIKKEPFKMSQGLFGKPDTSSFSSVQGGDRRPRIKGRLEQTGAGSSRQGQHEAEEPGLFGKPSKPSAAPRRPSTSGDEGNGRQLVKRQMSEDISTKVAIVCRNVAAKFNNVYSLRRHFVRFGEVAKVFPNPSKMQATIHFKTHAAAADAKRRGLLLQKGVPPMTIFWSSYSSTASPRGQADRGSRDEDPRPSKAVKRISDGSVLPKSKRTSWGSDTMKQDELSSMAGTHDYRFTRNQSPTPSGSNTRVKDIQQSPEKRARAVSPSSASSYTDKKGERISVGMFQGQIGRHTTDRLELLKLRDKYIRQNRVKRNTDITTAGAFVGTCPDMCPEKERYYREETRQLHYYEMVPGENIPGTNPRVDHTRAVKEYLRSSPDQDEPLPHELRPLPTLQLTMTYLLREIADRGKDGKWADWFDFLWNRTRGIRKDITQQQLCNRGTVDLLEKCARFHVYSSERLCEEDMHSFDAKINNENLTKSLQTLKEFYSDLEKKQKCFCENEAEFRGYMVLMNLNEGDMLREVQQLRPEVRRSREIEFALKVYSSLNNNNYIKFFRLVKQASFGAACIMHRYFTQVRNNALVSMMRGHSMGNRPAQIPLTELIRLLGFENEEETSDFCEYYGFIVSGGDALLDKAEYIVPESTWLPRRSVQLIESKLSVTPGQFMNGGAFIKEESYIPKSSFDPHSQQFNSAVELPIKGSATHGVSSREQQAPVRSEVKVEPRSTVPEDRQDARTTQPEIMQQPEVIQPPKPVVIPNEYIKDTAKVLFWEVIDEMTKLVSNETMTHVQSLLNYSDECVNNLILVDIQQELKTICEEVYDEEQMLLHKALLKEQEQRRDRVAGLLTDDVVYDLVYQEALNLATIEVREVKAQLKRESMERVTVEINQEMMEEVIHDMVSEVSDEIFETDVTQRLKQLDDFEKIVKLSRAGRYLEKWKQEYKAVTKLKRSMEQFPSATCMDSLHSQVNNLITVEDEAVHDGQFYVNKRARLTVEGATQVISRRDKINTQFTVHRLYKNLLHHIAWQPLDLTHVLGKHLVRGMTKQESRVMKQGNNDNRMSRSILWKVLVSLPDTDDMTESAQDICTHHVSQWLQAKLSKGPAPTTLQTPKSKAISVYKSTLPATARPSMRHVDKLGVCVRTVEGTLDYDEINAMEEDRLFLGSSAVIFLLPSNPPLNQPDSSYWIDNQLRLQRLLEVKPMYQALPLVIVIAVSANQNVSLNDLAPLLALDELYSANQLSDTKVMTLDIEPGYCNGVNVVNPLVSEKLCECIQWLGERCHPTPTLSVDYLHDVLDKILLQHYYTPVQHNLRKRRHLGRLDKEPNLLIELYNCVLQHVDDVLTSHYLSSISWPVPEFVSSFKTGIPAAHWNREDHFEYLSDVVRGLRLPQFCPLDPHSEAWLDVQRDLWMFVSQIAGRHYGPARVKLYSRLKKLLHTVEIKFEETCYLEEGEEACEPSYINIPWSNVINMCIDYRLETMDITDPDIPDTQLEYVETELRVAYDQDHLDKFYPPAEWRHIEGEQSILDTPSLNTTIRKAAYNKVQEKSINSVNKPEISIVEDPENVSILSVTTKKSSSALIESLRSERRRSDHFNKYLENALKGDNDILSNQNKSANVNNSVFESENVNPNNFTQLGNHSFDATAYFGQTSNDLSRIFDQTDNRRSSDYGTRRHSDLGEDSRRGSSYEEDWRELSSMPNRQRRKRLSQMFGNDPVILCLKQPTLNEDMQILQDNIKSSRRDSDLFEKKLQALMQNK